MLAIKTENLTKKYKDKVVRKLNLLVNNRPTLDEIIYITMNSYVERGYGSVESFKKEN